MTGQDQHPVAAGGGDSLPFPPALLRSVGAAMLGLNDSCFRFCAAFESADHGVAPGRVGVTLVMVEG